MLYLPQVMSRSHSMKDCVVSPYDFVPLHHDLNDHFPWNCKRLALAASCLCVCISLSRVDQITEKPFIQRTRLVDSVLPLASGGPQVCPDLQSLLSGHYSLQTAVICLECDQDINKDNFHRTPMYKVWQNCSTLWSKGFV